MRKSDFLPGCIFTLLAAAILWESYELGLGNFREPGGGLVPFLSGLLLFLCAVGILFRCHSPKAAVQESRRLWSHVDIRKLGLVLVCLTGYALLLESLGYLITTSLFFLVIFKSIGSLKLLTNLIVSILSAGISYVLFAVILKVALPSGFWGIG